MCVGSIGPILSQLIKIYWTYHGKQTTPLLRSKHISISTNTMHDDRQAFYFENLSFNTQGKRINEMETSGRLFIIIIYNHVGPSSKV